jgi:hypothetical protein
MAEKKSHASRRDRSDQVVARVTEALESGERHDQLILIIPSHDRKNHPIQDQLVWANAAAEQFAGLFGGATAFQALLGTFMDDEGKILTDTPILLECYAKREHVQERARMEQVADFAIRMGRETDQDTVALVVNDFMHYIKIAGR